ncbi:hypothetical protein [Oricola cellulosilytica]|uniref:Uncharacterized protein n=1 Tax=Oricola cellulosilytica TaxID=1429082 RepID=A0A4R0PEV0_9HYPH|nr:hypothetical protein [Oricola cellulosilytica]TCD15168.1 hypothetical protein E0D97_06360 [Oricola cellulosilytica]
MADPLTPNSSRSELRACWRSLSPPMRKALDAAADAPLRRRRHWWFANNSGGGFATDTIESLRRQGLLAVEGLHKPPGIARISDLGTAVFRSVGEGIE